MEGGGRGRGERPAAHLVREGPALHTRAPGARVWATILEIPKGGKIF